MILYDWAPYRDWAIVAPDSWKDTLLTFHTSYIEVQSSAIEVHNSDIEVQTSDIEVQSSDILI